MRQQDKISPHNQQSFALAVHIYFSLETKREIGPPKHGNLNQQC